MDGHDEKNCSQWICVTNTYQCNRTGQCILPSYSCDYGFIAFVLLRLICCSTHIGEKCQRLAARIRFHYCLQVCSSILSVVFCWANSGSFVRCLMISSASTRVVYLSTCVLEAKSTLINFKCHATGNFLNYEMKPYRFTTVI